ncbi:MAG: Spo0B domain-containing protein, partial [Bacillota bacterium]
VALIIPLDILMIKLLLRLPKIILVIFLYEFITLISQLGVVFTWNYVLGVSTTDLVTSPLIRILYPTSVFVPVTILACISHRKHWRVSMDTSRFKVPTAAILPIVIQVILLGAVINEFFFGSRFDEATRTTEAVIFAMLIAALVSSSFIFWRILQFSEREAAVTAQEALAAEMRKQIDTVRKQRHDFINHVQIMQALLSENRFTELSSFVDAIDKDIHKVHKVL